MNNSENIMYSIAKHYNDLNDSGNVKASRANEKGYARIKDITRGCTLLVVHSNNDQLVINLLISTAAKTRDESICNKAVEVFKSHFGSDVQYIERVDLRGSDRVHDSYYVDVTRRDFPELLIMIEEVKNKLAGA
jgi:hypothetical protein